MKFDEFLEKMSDNGFSNTICNPRKYEFIPGQLKMVGPLKIEEYDEDNVSHLLFHLDEESSTAIAYYGYYDKDFKYLSDWDKKRELEKQCYDKYVPYTVIPEEIEYEGVKYSVTGLYVRSTAWGIKLSSKVKDIYIDKRPQSEDAETKRFGFEMGLSENSIIRLGNSINSYFESNHNTNFADCDSFGVNTSLYSADKKKLYHYFRGYPTYTELYNGFYERNISLAKSLEIIEQGALQGLKCNSLTIPCGVRRIEDRTLKNAQVESVRLEGQLEYLGIDENLNTEFWINNSSDKVIISGFKDIRKNDIDTISTQKFHFAVPEPNKEPSKDGFIKLTRWYRSYRYQDSYETEPVSVALDFIAMYHPYPLTGCYDKEAKGTLITLMKKDGKESEAVAVQVLVCESCEIVERKISELKL